MSASPFVTARARAPRQLLVSMAGLVLAPAAVFAGEAPPATPPSPAQATHLAGVKVQAATLAPESPKFTASLLDTPRAITVVPQAIINDTASTTLVDALRTVPGITFGAGEGGNPVGDRPFIRGFDAGADVFVDGIRDTGSQSRETFDIEQIDVIKGPSSAYSGRGAAGGSINIATKAPLAENRSSASVGVGTDDYRRGTLDTNVLLSEHTAARLNVMAHQADVAGRDVVGGKRFGLAPSITFGLKTPTRLTLDYYHLNTNEMPDSGLPLDGPYTTGPFAGTGSGAPVKTDRDNFYGLVGRDFRKTRADIGTIRLEHDFDRFTLRNTARYGKTGNHYIWTNPDDSSGNVPNGWVYRSPKTRIADTRTWVDQLDLSGSFATGSLQHSVAGGLEFSQEKTAVDNYTVTVPPAPGDTSRVCGALQIANYACTPLAAPNPYDPWLGSVTVTGNPTRTTTRGQAAYVFDTVTFNEHWLANVGARYDRYRTEAVGVNTSVRSGPLGPFDYRNASNFLTWQAGLVFKPLEGGSVYASWGTSANPAGVASGEGSGDNANLGVTTADLAPQKSRNIELGTKWDLFGNRLSVSGAVFRSELTNARVQVDAATTALAGSKRVDGAEISVSGNLTRQWMVFAGYTYLDASLTDNGPFNALDNGNRFPNTPRHSASVWTTYAIAPRLTIGVGAFAMGKVYGNVQNTKWVPGYVRYDAMAAWRVNDRLSLQLNVQNLSDKTYFDKIYTTHYASVAPGRSALLSANFSF